MDEFLENLGFEKYSSASSKLRSDLLQCNVHLQRLKKRAACEEVIWKVLLNETEIEIDFFEVERQNRIAEALTGQAESAAQKEPAVKFNYL